MFNIMDLQREAMGNIKRNYWNTVMITAIFYGVLFALSIFAMIFLIPLQFFIMSMITLPPESMFFYDNATGFLDFFKSTFVRDYYLIINNIVPYSILYGVTILLNILFQFVQAPADAGAKLCYLDISHGKRARGGTVFSKFPKLFRFAGAYLWRLLFTTLWSLLLVIPGIIKGLSYSMMPYLVAEYPGLKARDALQLSIRITNGYKHKIFLMYLLVFAWALLYIPAAFMTCGLGGVAYLILWLYPLQAMMMAGMYNRLKMLAFESGQISADDLGVSPV